MTHLTPYLQFAGRCTEAMSYYQECLGGELELQKVGDTPMAAQMPPESHESIMHAELTSGDVKLFGSDMSQSDSVTHGDDVSLAISGTVEEIKAIWAKFAPESKVGHELTQEYFGTYGDLVDKYGNRWMFQADAPAQA